MHFQVRGWLGLIEVDVVVGEDGGRIRESYSIHRAYLIKLVPPRPHGVACMTDHVELIANTK
jgi:hypothetical protein